MRLYVLLFLLLSSTTFALSTIEDSTSITVPLEGIKKIVIPFYSPIDDTIIFSLRGEKPWMILSDSKITVKRNTTTNVTLFLSPKSATTQLAIYKVDVVGESLSTDAKESADYFVSITKESGVYAERIIVKGDLKPTGSVNLSFDIKNFGEVTIQESFLEIVVRSPNGVMHGSSTTIKSINPSELRPVTKTIELPEGAPAGKYTIEATVRTGGQAFKLNQEFHVESTPILVETTEGVGLVLGGGKKVTVKNIGNEPGEYKLIDEISLFNSYFFSGNRATNIDGETYTWIYDIDPGQEISIEYKVDYLPLLFVILAIIAAYKILISNTRVVKIKKFVMQKKKISEGTEFTVGIEIKNSTGRDIENVAIKDFIPTVFKTKDVHGVKPVKKKTAIGTSLTWSIDRMKKNEVRLFSYRIVPVFGIGGKIGIPAAKATYSSRGRYIESRSGAPELGIVTSSNEE